MFEKQQDLYTRLAECRMDAHQIGGREGAIVVRYIEDAMCRLDAAHKLQPLPTPPR